MKYDTLKYVADEIDKGFEELDLPEYMKDGVMLYVFQGVRPGSFLTAVLENNLTQSFGQADHNNVACMFDWAKLLYMYLPSQCWGSKEIVANWKGFDNA